MTWSDATSRSLNHAPAPALPVLKASSHSCDPRFLSHIWSLTVPPARASTAAPAVPKHGVLSPCLEDFCAP